MWKTKLIKALYKVIWNHDPKGEHYPQGYIPQGYIPLVKCPGSASSFFTFWLDKMSSQLDFVIN